VPSEEGKSDCCVWHGPRGGWSVSFTVTSLTKNRVLELGPNHHPSREKTFYNPRTSSAERGKGKKRSRAVLGTATVPRTSNRQLNPFKKTENSRSIRFCKAGASSLQRPTKSSALSVLGLGGQQRGANCERLCVEKKDLFSDSHQVKKVVQTHVFCCVH